MLAYNKICISGMTGVSDANLRGYKTRTEELCPGAQVDILSKEILPEEECIRRMQGYDVLMSGFQTMTDRAYAETNLVAFVACSIGFDFTNVEAATRHGVIVANNPAYCVAEVAEHICALTLNCARNIDKMATAVRNGKWGFPVIAPQNRFSDSTVGFYGFGRIPRMAASKLSGFGTRILANDPYLTQEQIAGTGVTLVSFNGLLEESDYIIIQVPLMPSTTGVFNREVFRKMKNTACLINTARGPLVVQDDLYEALTTGEIRAAALDVIGHEPPQESEKRLLELPNVLCTGHTAFYSEESLQEQMEQTCQNLARVCRGELPLNVVNRQLVGQSPLK